MSDSLEAKYPMVYALARDLQVTIATMEVKAHEDIERLKSYDDPEPAIRERWGRFCDEVEPMRQHLSYLFRKLGDVMVYEPTMWFVANGEGLTLQTAEPGNPLSWSTP